ncbi:bifunctional riboflavin kinase/FAD synthetase [Propionimicrobium sp. PCR01-08-3]|uniref:bifunctional riboflavin kinase/FAD synthetase n=1 Tax=Propionimicrobium sp. PCR01-08-3 TaxID=3052086 RepID=UPI00255C6582|nr:bifunctional riboflavin kinase/FAD synthetase [Propionimicrobium sp. PCR01-08-3]WIY81575.1 bifunctional riboflavin kinase/FAD synthetase [Propionimicrobium sp. PCR01-08-3]
MQQSVVAIGNFDGVHTGHQKLLETARRHARELGTEREPLPVIVVTFWPHPLRVLTPGKAPKLLTPLADRINLLRNYGADEVRVVQFNRDVASWSPERFVDTILGPLNPAVVVVGKNFTFGARAAGTPEMMREIAGDRFDVDVIHLVGVDSERTCSSFVRQALADGRVDVAARHLGRLFRVSGVVVVGDQRGRELGFPTANLPIAADLATPADGVYAGWLRRLDEPSALRLPAAISVGTNPTFDGLERRVESYVLDRTDLELYGIEISVEFVKQLRGQVRFLSVDELIEQMSKDVAATRNILGAD